MTLILQNDESDCLLACYAMILDHLGSRVMLTDLQKYRKDRRHGTSLGELREANEAFGLTMSALKTDGRPNLPSIRKELRLPLIAHLNRGHFVVITAITKTSVRLNDPAFGPAEMTVEEFAEVSSGVFITFAKSETFTPVTTRPHPLSILRNLNKKTIGLLVVAVLVAQLVTTGLSLLSKALLDRTLTSPVEIGLLVGALVLLIVFSAEVQRRSAHRGVDDFEFSVSRSIFQGLSRKSLMWVKNRGTGRVVEQISLRNQIRDILLQDLGPTVVSIMTLVPVFVYMAVLDPLMAGILGLSFVAYLVALTRLSLKRFYQYQGYVFGQVEMSGQITGDLDRWKEVAIRRDNKAVSESWFNHSKELCTGYKACLSVDRDIQIATQMFSVGSSIVVVILGSLLIHGGSMSLGDLVIIQLLNGLLASAASTIQNGVLSARNLGTFFYSLLDITHGEEADTEITPPARAGHEQGSLIEGKNLEIFRGDTTLGSAIDISVRPGQITEVCGPSGSGKTTLIDSLLGLLPARGNLRFDPALDFDRIGISSPDIKFQPQRLRDFLDPFGQESDEELARVLWLVGLDDVIADGDISAAPSSFVSALSTGQMQRLVLARSLILGDQLVIWDEPFGTLDKDTAKLVIDRVFSSERAASIAFLLVTHQSFANLQADDRVLLA